MSECLRPTCFVLGVAALSACTPLNAPTDAAADGPANQDTPAATGCSRFSHGPAMVMAPTPTRMICIDATEVTQAQYQQFLDSKNGDTTGQATECMWNNVYGPSQTCTFDPTGHGAYPVNGVDWCDAVAYCAWAGKRLCGGPTGGLIETSAKADLAMAQVSEWAAACTHSGDRAYPYGTAFNGAACNGGESRSTPAIVPVATTPGCEGAYPGIFDLVGNVHEWVDACYQVSGTPGRRDKCWFSGGSYHDPENSCASAWDVTRDYVDSLCDIGFRCCADP